MFNSVIYQCTLNIRGTGEGGGGTERDAIHMALHCKNINSLYLKTLPLAYFQGEIKFILFKTHE
jgi:hypothetical protein